MRGPSGVPVGVIRRLLISNVTCLGAGAERICSILSGIPGYPIEDVKLSDITIVHPGGGTTADAALQIAEKEKDYPEPTMFGTTPACGFFLRHVRGIEMSGIKIESATLDARHVFALHDVQNADFRHIKMPAMSAAPRFVLNDVTDFSVFRCKPVPDTELGTAEKKTL
jgi:hypothetical protein